MRLLEFARESGWKSAREAAVRGGNGYEIFETRNDGLLRRRDAKFYGSLTDEQKERFNRLAPVQG